MPVGKGKCPRCGRVLRLNFVARRHPVNVLRVDQLLADLLAQFPPADIIERCDREQLAVTLEQLETMRPGTTEWQRLVTVAQMLGAALRDSQASRQTASPPAEDLTPDALNARLAELHRMIDSLNAPPVVHVPTAATTTTIEAVTVPAPGDGDAPATTPSKIIDPDISTPTPTPNDPAARQRAAVGTGIEFRAGAGGKTYACHALGDHHAEQILNGTIPLAEARRQERERRQLCDEMMRGMRGFSY
jgi:hypothetical protein